MSMNSELLKIAKGSSILFLSKIIAYLLAFIFNLVVARYLGANIYGSFIFVFSTLSLLTVFIQLGNKNGLMYYIPRLKEDGKNYKDLISTTITMSFIIGIVVVIVTIFFLSKPIGIYILGSESYINAVKILTIVVFMDAISEILKASLRGNDEIKHFAFGGVLVHFFRIFIIMIFILMEVKTNILIVSYIISSLLIVFYYLLVLKGKKMYGKINLNSMKLYFSMLLLFIPTMFTALLSVMHTQIDKIMIGNYLGAGSVGIYNIATVIANLSSFIFAVISAVISPIISKIYYSGDMQKLSDIYKTVSKWTLIANLLFLSIILILSEDILRLFGSEFKIGATVLILVSIGQLFNSIAGPSAAIINMTGHTKVSFYFYIVTVIMNLILNFIFIPLYGINGAAFTTMVSLITLNILNVVFIYIKMKLHPFSFKMIKQLLIIAISFIFTIIIYELLSLQWLASLFAIPVILVGFYFMVSYFIGYDKEDRNIIMNIANKIYRNSI
ncbi:flippase [Sporosarcina sp. FA15]|uniref:flippase n=1 Tax=Sporosarcina sp. FA15 TaxID=3413031 RepID=UPI003F65A092